MALVLGGGLPAVAVDEVVDVCLELSAGAISAGETAELEAAVESAISARGALFPQPVVVSDGAGRIDIYAGHDHGGAGLTDPCLQPGSGWTARFGRDFLAAGADQMLAEAPTTPGIDSEVDIEWFPEERRLRTTLVFAGPLDIPNGTCWIDDALTVDAESGIVAASRERGLETSLFAEGACGRFFDHLPDGGAGEQAVTLLPATVVLDDGTTLRFVAGEVSLEDDSVVVAGSLERS